MSSNDLPRATNVTGSCATAAARRSSFARAAVRSSPPTSTPAIRTPGRILLADARSKREAAKAAPPPSAPRVTTVARTTAVPRPSVLRVCLPLAISSIASSEGSTDRVDEVDRHDTAAHVADGTHGSGMGTPSDTA